jgi:hypothetical protein
MRGNYASKKQQKKYEKKIKNTIYMDWAGFKNLSKVLWYQFIICFYGLYLWTTMHTVKMTIKVE